MDKRHTTGTATVDTDDDTGESFIMIKVGPFPSRRAALRKAGAWVKETNPVDVSLVTGAERSEK